MVGHKKNQRILELCALANEHLYFLLSTVTYKRIAIVRKGQHEEIPFNCCIKCSTQNILVVAENCTQKNTGRCIFSCDEAERVHVVNRLEKKFSLQLHKKSANRSLSRQCEIYFFLFFLISIFWSSHKPQRQTRLPWNMSCFYRHVLAKTVITTHTLPTFPRSPTTQFRHVLSNGDRNCPDTKLTPNLQVCTKASLNVTTNRLS